MSDPYRTAGMPCPHCRATLRAFGERLICDACTGIQIPLAELEKALSLGPVRVEDGAATAQECPRCARAMVLATIAVVEQDSAVASRCGAHGVWFDTTEVLQAFFRSFRSPGGGAATVGNAPLQGSGAGYAFTGDWGSGLSIQHWWERTRPRTHTLYRSPHDAVACPTCGAALALVDERWPCASCNGAFVDNPALVDMMMEMTGRPWELPRLAGGPARPCPVCKEAMRAMKIEAVEVERCGAHGVWFGPDALRAALLHAAQV